LNLLRLWAFVGVIALAIQLGSVPLLDADEGRNAEVAREMTETNDYVMPRLDGLPYLDKPIVYFAAEAAVMEVLGPTELAARLPAYLFTIATALVLFLYARRVWGGATPWVASIVFLSMPLVVAFARTVIFDSALMFFTTIALTAFHLSIETRNRHWSILAWGAMGMAMITKGPVVFVLVLFVVVPYAWRRKALRVLFPFEGLLLFLAITIPWVWAVSQVVPEFLRYVLVTETAARMATDELKRTGPPWYFLPYLIGGALPWSIVAAANWKKFRRPDPAIVFWLLALVIPFVFFSISQSKRAQYILPLMPALALLVARIWEEARTRATAITYTTLGALLVAASFFVHRTKMKPELQAVADETALAFGVAFAVAGVMALFSKRRDLVLIALTLPVFALPIIATPMLHAISDRRSAKSFVQELAPHLTPHTQIIGVEAFTGSMAFYLRRPITVVTKDATELTSNYLIRRYERFSTNPAAPIKPLSYFERSLGATNDRVYVVRRKDVRWQQILEARGWQLVADGTHHLAYARP
jgi:4-amino-4-deoxy-L-arabinose transferase-like glycosyltransferase